MNHMIFAVGLLAAPMFALAATKSGADALSACIDKATAQGGFVRSATASCLADEAKRQDAELNAAYKQAMKVLPTADQPKLVAAQRAWIKFRDAHCAMYADPDGGAEADGNVAECMATQSAERAKGIRNVVDNLK